MFDVSYNMVLRHLLCFFFIYDKYIINITTFKNNKKKKKHSLSIYKWSLLMKLITQYKLIYYLKKKIHSNYSL